MAEKYLFLRNTMEQRGWSREANSELVLKPVIESLAARSNQEGRR